MADFLEIYDYIRSKKENSNSFGISPDLIEFMEEELSQYRGINSSLNEYISAYRKQGRDYYEEVKSAIAYIREHPEVFGLKVENEMFGLEVEGETSKILNSLGVFGLVELPNSGREYIEAFPEYDSTYPNPYNRIRSGQASIYQSFELYALSGARAPGRNLDRYISPSALPKVTEEKDGDAENITLPDEKSQIDPAHDAISTIDIASAFQSGCSAPTLASRF